MSPASAPARKKMIVYTFTPRMHIRLSDGREVTLAALARMVANGATFTAYAPWSASKEPSPTRIKANLSSDGLALFDSKTWVSHRFVDRAPVDPSGHLAEMLKVLRES